MTQSIEELSVVVINTTKAIAQTEKAVKFYGVTAELLSTMNDLVTIRKNTLDELYVKGAITINSK